MNHPPQILDRCAKNSKVTEGTSQKVAKKHRTAMCYIYRFCSDSSVSSWTILPETCHYLEHKIWQSWRLDPKRYTLQCEVVVYFLDVHIAIRCIHTPIRLQYGPEVFRTFLLRGFLSWPIVAFEPSGAQKTKTRRRFQASSSRDVKDGKLLCELVPKFW